MRQVEVGIVKNSAFAGTYNGVMTVRLWADAGGVPGALLATSTAPVSLSDTLPQIFAAQFGGVIVPTATIWTGVQFSYTTQLGAGIVQGWSEPSVGSWGGHDARHYSDSTWNVVPWDAPTFFRIDTVPSPAGACVLGLAGLAVFRRRR